MGNTRLTASEVDSLIREFEEKFDLLKFSLDGWAVWPLFRMALGNRLMKNVFSRAKQPWVGDYLRHLVFDVFPFCFPKKKDLVVYSYSSNRTEFEGGKFKDIFFDDILENCSSFLKIENLDKKQFLKNSAAALVKSDITTIIFQGAAWLGSKGFCSRDIKAIAFELERLIFEEFGEGVFSQAEVVRLLTNFRWSRKVYAWYLRRLGAKKAIVVTSYGLHSFIAAAKDEKLEVIEYQHGAVDRFHWGYSWSEYARDKKKRMSVPDKILLFGDYWKDEMAFRCFWDEELIPVGSLRVDQYRRQKGQREEKPIQVLFTSQGLETQAVVDFWKKFFTLSKGDVHLVIKLHPSFDSEKSSYQIGLKGLPVTVYDSSEIPSVFRLLLDSHVHMSIFSTVHFEAVGLGIPSIVLGLRGYENMSDLINRGAVRLIGSPEALVVYFSQKIYLESVPGMAEFLFKENAKENFLRVINSET